MRSKFKATIEMTAEALIDLRLLAKANGRPVSSEALIAIEDYLKRFPALISKAARTTTVPARRHFEK